MGLVGLSNFFWNFGIFLTLQSPQGYIKQSSTHLDRRHGKEELSVEAARPSQCGVDGVDLVGRPDDDDLAAVVQPVHQRQQRGHDGAVDLVLATRPHRGEAVDLVEEDDGRTGEVGLK